MYWNSNWSLREQAPKKRIRTKRKERMTWQQWLQDWFQSLHSLGWSCRNPEITPDRKRLTEAELAGMGSLKMQRGEMVVCLYPSRETVPGPVGDLDEWRNCVKPVKRVIRIVRGRRPDPQRAIARVADGTATNIVPSHPPFDQAPYMVDFEGGLFTATGRGDWQLTQVKEYQDIYSSYREASPHLHSFRKYVRRPERMAPQVCLIGGGTNLLGFDWKPVAPLK
jgi:hypothetical protein